MSAPGRRRSGCASVLPAATAVLRNAIQSTTVANAYVKPIVGGYVGAHALKHLPAMVLKVGVVVIGIALTIGLFLRG